jgi:hypothetical protein
VQFCELLWDRSCTDFMEGMPVVGTFIGWTTTNLQLMCHFINSHLYVLQDHAIDSFHVCLSNGCGMASGSFPMINVVRPFLNVSIHSQTIRCDMTLFPYCNDIILCILEPGTPSAHKNVSLPSALVWCKWNWSVHVYGTKLMAEMDYQVHTCITVVGVK